jgi:5S rRNA maturation endonuclease (ribonuclease M5)
MSIQDEAIAIIKELLARHDAILNADDDYLGDELARLCDKQFKSIQKAKKFISAMQDKG